MSKHTAVMLLGNAGSGKSTLLTQLGGTVFPSGVQFRKGYTKDIYEEWIILNGEPVCLIDVPGLYEPSETETKFNAQKLNLALSRDYEYKLFFVLKASNRGPDDGEIVMMSKISESIKQVNGCRVSFRVIVNQIMDQRVYDMYQDHLAKDNFVSFFGALDIPGFSFNIKIDGVILLRFDEEGVTNNKFRKQFARDVDLHRPSAIHIHKEIKASNKELTVYQKALEALSLLLYNAGKEVHEFFSRLFS